MEKLGGTAPDATSPGVLGGASTVDADPSAKAPRRGLEPHVSGKVQSGVRYLKHSFLTGREWCPQDSRQVGGRSFAAASVVGRPAAERHPMPTTLTDRTARGILGLAAAIDVRPTPIVGE